MCSKPHIEHTQGRETMGTEKAKHEGLAGMAEAPLYIPRPVFSYFCKSGEVRPVMNRWAEREYKISESCYRPIDDLFHCLDDRHR